MKYIFKQIPEIILILGVCLYWHETKILFNPIAILMLTLLILTIITKNAIITSLTSLIFIFLSVFMILAVISEYREFETTNLEGVKLLIIGLFTFSTSLFLSFAIGIKTLKS